MIARARAEDGFLMIEVVAAIVILTIALLAVMAGYDAAFISLHRANQKAVAAKLANQQLELFGALSYDAIGLDPTLTANVGDPNNAAYDSLYATNSLLDGAMYTDANGNPAQYPSGTVNDVTTTGPCGATPNCLPVQTVTGPDGKTYRIETFIRDDDHTSNHRWTTRDVTVVIRDPSVAGDPEIVSAQAGFDQQPAS
jgi:type II secretory pathway pseudopilin PulG